MKNSNSEGFLAEVLEVVGTSFIAQCFNSSSVVSIGSIVLVSDLKQEFLAVVTSVKNTSRFPGGVQAFGLGQEEVLNSYPELWEIEIKTLECQTLAWVNSENNNLMPCFGQPSSHSTVKELSEDRLKWLLGQERFIKIYCSFIAQNTGPEIIFAGLSQRVGKLENFDKSSFYQMLLINLSQSSSGALELVKRLCLILELCEPALTFI